MYRVSLLILIFILSNCGGGGGGTSGTTPLPSGVGLTVTALSNGNPIIGATVQLDNAGQTATTNANGDAVFLGVTGTHDIHVFSDKHVWISAYQVTKSRVYLNTTAFISSGASGSFINIKGSIANIFVPVSGSKSALIATFTTQNNNYTSGLGSASFTGTYNGFISLYDIPPGTSVSGQLRIYQLEPVGSQESRIVDMIQLGTKTFTTDAILQNAPITLNLVFNTTKPTWVIQTVNGVTLPTGVSLQSIWTSAGSLTLNTNKAPVFPLTVFSAIPQPVPNNVTICTNATSWRRCEPSPLFGTISISSAIKSMPSIASGQSGSQIIVTPATGANQTIQRLSISDPLSGSKWTLLTSPHTTTVTLPQLPANVIPRLVLGKNYSIVSQAISAAALTYDQYLNTKSRGYITPYESATSAAPVSYVR